VKISKEGLIYVCDRGNNRVQVFNGRDPNIGKECSNPTGDVGKCGFVKEQSVAVTTNGLPGSAVSMNFSTDPKQTCLYVGDNSNMTIYILKRDTLEELGRLGRSGRGAGDFHWLHQVSLDSDGNIYTAEVDTGKHIRSSSDTASKAAAVQAGRRSGASCRNFERRTRDGCGLHEAAHCVSARSLTFCVFHMSAGMP
jgi:DNA-binding beta-propeller fold protein YncE